VSVKFIQFAEQVLARRWTLWFVFLCGGLLSCGGDAPTSGPAELPKKTMTTLPQDDWQAAPAAGGEVITDANGFIWQTERFADVQILRYQVAGWDRLSLRQKQLAYYLTQAGLAGRDIMWDQNYRHNLAIRAALEAVYTRCDGDRNTLGWRRFETYLKRLWFASGIHHHYSNIKFTPEFSRDYFREIVKTSGVEIRDELMEVIFNPELDPKKVELNPDKGLLEHSAVNFYAPDITTAEAQHYYQEKSDAADPTPVSHGLNSRLARDENGRIYEQVWKSDGRYGAAIREIIVWLEQAQSVAENDRQAQALEKLIAYYRAGDLKLWDEYNILWTGTTEGDIDYINGFVEVYDDPLGYKGSYESIVQVKDAENSRRMRVLMEHAGWFEQNSPVMDEHKRDDVVGIVYNVVNVVGEAGDASPSTPVGVNLPNANWIRSRYGSKSVSLGNIEQAYRETSGTLLADEFAHDEQEKEWNRSHGDIVDPLKTALHEVIGHASGRIEEGVGEHHTTLKNYASTIEEGRADLMALYFLMDPKLVEMGLLPSADAAKSGYDTYIRNGLLQQLRRIEPGADIEEAHMRNRAWISRWVLEQGRGNNVIAEVRRDNKTYYDIRDYQSLRGLFGRLLREVQRIKSQGDYAAARTLVETYGIKADPALHTEVRARSEKLNIPPFAGFLNPVLTPVLDDAGNIIDVKLEYARDFAEQMLYYSQNYGYLVDQR
jgi:dipeptidyl-peptidase-3